MARPQRRGLWRTKSIEQSIRDTDEPGTRLRRELTVWDLTVFGVAVVVGAGIFSISASTAGDLAGPSVSLAFVISAVVCALAALCYAELASVVPVAGSAYTYSYATFGEFVAWILGWDLVLEFAVGAAVVAKAWSTYLAQVLHLAGLTVSTAVKIGGLTVDWGALLVVAVLAALLAYGTKLSSRVSQVITAIKVGVVLLVVVVGLGYIQAANYRPFVPPAAPPSAGKSGLEQSVLSLLTGAGSSTFGWYGLLAAASIVFFAFIGFDVVATTAEETRNPQRDTPRGILGSLAIVTVLYVAVALVVTGMVPYTSLATKDGAKATLATAFADRGVDWAATVIAVGALAGLTTVVLVLMLGQTRVLFAMSRDGLLPRTLAHTGSRGTPVRATVLVCAVIGFAAGFFPAGRLEEMVNVGTLFAFVLVSAGVLVLRRMRPDLTRAFRVRPVPWVPIAAVLACLWLMINLTALTWLRFLVWMVVGLLVYYAYGRRHSVLGRREAAGTAGTTDAAGAAEAAGRDRTESSG